jgi:hypothetical protein
MVLWILGQASVVSFLVSALKSIPYVGQHPKLVAGFLNLVLSWFVTIILPIPEELKNGLVVLLNALIAQLAASGVYEHVTKPARTMMRGVK